MIDERLKNDIIKILKKWDNLQYDQIWLGYSQLFDELRDDYGWILISDNLMKEAMKELREEKRVELKTTFHGDEFRKLGGSGYFLTKNKKKEKKMKYIELYGKILTWAQERDLLKPENKFSQLAKVSEELFAELFFFLEIYPDGEKEIKDAIGDVQVTLIIFCYMVDVDYMKLIVELPEYIRLNPDYFNKNWVAVEMGRISETTLKNRTKINIEDSVIYILAYLHEVAAYKYNTNLTECLQLAYNEIEYREGETRNGTFVKKEDI